MKQIINLRFDQADDGSGDGTLIISADDFDLFFASITHTKQKDN
jgi:hypothetical protein